MSFKNKLKKLVSSGIMKNDKLLKIYIQGGAGGLEWGFKDKYVIP